MNKNREKSKPQTAHKSIEQLSYKTFHIIDDKFVLPTDLFLVELKEWSSRTNDGTNKNQAIRFEATKKGLFRNSKPKPIQGSQAYSKHEKWATITEEQLNKLHDKQSIEAFLKQQADELVNHIEQAKEGVFFEWQKISNLTTISLLYQCSMLADILNKKTSLLQHFEQAGHKTNIYDPKEPKAPAQVTIHNTKPLSISIDGRGHEVKATPLAFLHFLERIDYLLTNAKKLNGKVMLLPPGHHAGVPTDVLLGCKGYCWAYSDILPALNHGDHQAFIIDTDINAQTQPLTDEKGYYTSPPPYFGENDKKVIFAEVAANGVYPIQPRIDKDSQLYRDYYKKEKNFLRVDANTYINKKPHHYRHSSATKQQEIKIKYWKVRNSNRKKFEAFVYEHLNNLAVNSMVILSLGLDSIEGNLFQSDDKTDNTNKVAGHSALWNRVQFDNFITDIQFICQTKMLVLLTTLEGGYRADTLTNTVKSIYRHHQQDIKKVQIALNDKNELGIELQSAKDNRLFTTPFSRFTKHYNAIDSVETNGNCSKYLSALTGLHIWKQNWMSIINSLNISQINTAKERVEEQYNTVANYKKIIEDQKNKYDDLPYFKHFTDTLLIELQSILEEYKLINNNQSHSDSDNDLSDDDSLDEPINDAEEIEPTKKHSSSQNSVLTESDDETEDENQESTRARSKRRATSSSRLTSNQPKRPRLKPPMQTDDEGIDNFRSILQSKIQVLQKDIQQRVGKIFNNLSQRIDKACEKAAIDELKQFNNSVANMHAISETTKKSARDEIKKNTPIQRRKQLEGELKEAKNKLSKLTTLFTQKPSECNDNISDNAEPVDLTQQVKQTHSS